MRGTTTTGEADDPAAARDLRDAPRDLDARNRVVERNYGLVVHVARGYLGRGLEQADLEQAGFLGLMVAAERFDAARGLQFSTYATHWIRWAIRLEIAETSRAIRIPRHAWDSVVSYRKAAARLEAATGEVPGEAAVLDAMGVKSTGCRETVAHAVWATTRATGPLASGMAAPPVVLEADAADLSPRLATALARLGDAHRRLLVRAYGLDGAPAAEGAELADLLGVEGYALARLRWRAHEAFRQALICPDVNLADCRGPRPAQTRRNYRHKETA